MKTKLYIPFLWLLCVSHCIAGVPQANQAKHADDNNYYEHQLTSLLNSLNKITGVPGFSVSVVHKGKLVASVATGFADAENQVNTKSDTTFRLASVSKIVGATMLAELVINGELNPDQGIGHYFPELNPKYHNITVSQLVSHTSGMPHYQIKDYDIYDDYYSSALAAVATLKDRDLLSRPGQKYLYSSHGYTLAGAIYEKITKIPLSSGIPNFVRRWTGRGTPALENIHELRQDSSKLYELSNAGANKIDHGEKSYSIFGAGLVATSEDLASFGASVLMAAEDNSELSKLLFTPTQTIDGNTVKDRQFSVGFGWRIAKDTHGRQVYHHAGSTPGARSILVIYPEYDLSIAFLSSSSWVSSIDKLAFALANLYIDGAQSAAMAPSEYLVRNQNKTLTGTTKCKENQCYLIDNTTDYAHWLNTFNSSSDPVTEWPIFLFDIGEGHRLLMVNKIGITAFEADDDIYIADVAKNQTYSIQLKK